jgi:pantoate--beta-alanine ligase
MNVITTVATMETERRRLKGTVGLVPTMGYLHEGHMSLVHRARADNDHVIVTIFVNPAQFGASEDLARYPRDEQRDLALLEETVSTQHSALSTHTVFIPTADEIYPPGFDDWVEVTGPIAARLEGAHRPGHFRGVTTVCARLFRMVRPDRAYFGQKDAQQLRVVRRMVEEQSIPVDIIPMPIVREPDGLAMSSRNVYMTPEQRTLALRLNESLRVAGRLVAEGATQGDAIRKIVLEHLRHPDIEIDYISVADEQTLEELDAIDRPALVLIAARIGGTRLIDNTIVAPRDQPLPADLRPLVES